MGHAKARLAAGRRKARRAWARRGREHGAGVAQSAHRRGPFYTITKKCGRQRCRWRLGQRGPGGECGPGWGRVLGVDAGVEEEVGRPVHGRARSHGRHPRVVEPVPARAQAASARCATAARAPRPAATAPRAGPRIHGPHPTCAWHTRLVVAHWGQEGSIGVRRGPWGAHHLPSS